VVYHFGEGFNGGLRVLGDVLLKLLGELSEFTSEGESGRLPMGVLVGEGLLGLS
jgi:hypothetical protein